MVEWHDTADSDVASRIEKCLTRTIDDGEHHDVYQKPFYVRFRATLDWCLEHRKTVIALTVGAFVLSLVATIYPSWRASRVNPAEALRYE